MPSLPNAPVPRGLLLIDKPVGLTSHDVVAQVRKIIKEKNYQLSTTNHKLRVGHTGTLDPFATGLLLVAVGAATRLIQFSHAWPKTYQATAILGATSDTDDITGHLTPHNGPITPPTPDAIEQALQQFIGTIEQTPPLYAAIKFKGKKLYELARANRPAEELQQIGESRRRCVTIHHIELLDITYPEVTISVTCSTGTYIRALVRDVGAMLGIGAYVSSLRRTHIGPFDVQQALGLDELSTAYPQGLLPPDQLVQDLPALIITSHNVEAFQQGKKIIISPASDQRLSSTGPLAIYNDQQHFIGIGTSSPASNELSPTLVMPFP